MLEANVLLRDEVIQYARARSDALIRKDVPALDRLLADEFVYTNAHGLVLSKAAYLENYVVPPEIQWESQAMDDVQVLLYGETAVLTFRVHDVAMFRAQRLDQFYRSTFVWVNQAGAWRCVAGQTTSIA